MEWYDPGQVTTRNGSLVITMDSTATTQAGITPGKLTSSLYMFFDVFSIFYSLITCLRLRSTPVLSFVRTSRWSCWREWVPAVDLEVKVYPQPLGLGFPPRTYRIVKGAMSGRWTQDSASTCVHYSPSF